MREAILRVGRRGLLWTIWRMFSRVLIVRTTSLSDCKETLGRELVSRNVWWIRVNTLRDGILRSGKRLWCSSRAAHALQSQKTIHKMHVTIFHVGKHKRHFSNTVQLTCLSQRSLKLYCVWWGNAAREFLMQWNSLPTFQLKACNARLHSKTNGVRVLADKYSAWTRKKNTLFSGHYLLNLSNLDIGVLGYIGIF